MGKSHQELLQTPHSMNFLWRPKLSRAPSDGKQWCHNPATFPEIGDPRLGKDCRLTGPAFHPPSTKQQCLLVLYPGKPAAGTEKNCTSAIHPRPAGSGWIATYRRSPNLRLEIGGLGGGVTGRGKDRGVVWGRCQAHRQVGRGLEEWRAAQSSGGGVWLGGVGHDRGTGGVVGGAG